MLEVTPEREQGSGWLALGAGTDGSVQRGVALPDGIEVRGHVRAVDGGAPIAGARVGEGWTYRRSATTDASGAFVLPGFGAEGVQELYACAPGFGEVQRVNLPAAVDGVLTVEFALPRGRRVRGRVLDAEARPLAGAYVAAVASVDGPEGQRTDWVSGTTDGGGEFELDGLTPDLRHCLLASADGFATQVYDFPPDELEQPELVLDAIELAAPAVLAGRVEDEEGRPVGDVEVTLAGANRDRGRFRIGSSLDPNGEGEWYVNSRVARGGADGRFWFGALPAGTYEIRARRAGAPGSPSRRLEIEEGEMRDGFVLTFPRGEAIRGTVVDETGRGLDGVYVIASLEKPRVAGDAARRDGVSVRTDASGAFEIQGLVPGTYGLRLHPYELESNPDSPWLSDRIEGIASGGDALRLVLPRGVSISGRLVDPSGAALVGYTILATRDGDGDSPGDATDAEGRFHLAVRPGTIWDLAVHGAPQTDAWRSIFAEEPSVAAGTHELVLHADPARPLEARNAVPSRRTR
jgi:protocatechuate 3,4-dioxygenase beta subunit